MSVLSPQLSSVPQNEISQLIFNDSVHDPLINNDPIKEIIILGLVG
jgi:hypothetical protein